MNMKSYSAPLIKGCLCLVLLCGRVSAAGPSNSVTISNSTASAQANSPISISRIFAQGELPNYPQPSVGGQPPAAWQSDVKNRWPDGSVKHAIISFSQTVNANASVVVDFVNNTNPCSSGNQAACDNAGLSTTQAMLTPPWMSGSPAWNAQIEVTNGSTLTVNARTMLGNLSLNPNQIRYWLRGPVVTQVMVEDRSTTLSQDIGWDSNKSLHPWFVLTFYNGWQGVKAEYIMENCWTTKLEDISYSVVLKAGSSLGQVYSKGTFPHLARSRWHKTFWSGATPGTLKIDYNLPYMVYSKVLPNYDLTKSGGKSAVAGIVNAFTSTDQGDIMGHGQYAQGFGNTGGRPELGLIETWALQYLYTFDPSVKNVLLGNGDVSGHVPIHFRESQTSGGGQSCASSRCFDAGKTVDGFGRVVSIDARPTMNTMFGDRSTAADTITPVGAAKCNGDWYAGCTTTYDGSAVNKWTPDLAHQAAFGFVPYLITGEYYWLEELQFWAAADVAASGYTCWIYGRCGTWGIIHEGSVQFRGVSWAMRNLAHAAFLAPDNSPESAYFNEKMRYNLGVREGQYNITNGSFYDTKTTSTWYAGRNTFGAGYSNPLQFPAMFNNLDGGCSATQENCSAIQKDSQPWQTNMWMVVLGHIHELGFPVATETQFVAQHIIMQILDPAYNPYLIANYTYPLLSSAAGKPYFSTWQSELGAFLPNFLSSQTVNKFPSDIASPSDPDFGYVAIAWAAASYLPGYSKGSLSGQAAWNWVNTTIPTSNASQLPGNMSLNPKWALLPRNASTIARAGACDVNGDGVVDAGDVQAALNQALGACTTFGDINHDGSCNVLDVQIAIYSSQGHSCPY